MKDLYVGVILAFFSAFTYALGSIFVQLIDRAVPDLQLNFYRCIGQTILSGLLLVVKQQHPVVTGKRQIFFASVVGVSGGIQNVLIFVAVLLIPVGSAGSLFHAGSIIFTLLGAWVLRMEHITFRKLVAFSLTFLGISLTLFSIIRPQHSYVNDDSNELQSYSSNIWIDQTHDKNASWESTVMNVHNESQGQFSSITDYTHHFFASQVFGGILALGSGLAQTGLILGEKKVLTCDPPVTGPVLSFWVSAAGLPISIALVPIFEKLTFVTDIWSILLVIGHAAAAGISIILFCLALERAPGVVVSLTFTSDLPIRVLAQYLVIPDYQPPGGGLYDIIGSVVVTIALCLPGFWELLDERQEKKKTNNEELMPLQDDKNEDDK